MEIKNVKNRIETLENKGVLITDTIEEFEYLLLTDYSVRANAYVVIDKKVELYDGYQYTDIQLDNKTFNTTIKEMTSLLDKYGFRKLKVKLYKSRGYWYEKIVSE